MDLPSLALILRAAALSPNPDERKASEQQLNQLQHTPQHLVRLLQIAVDGNCDMAVRQIASIQFKNFIAKNWSPDDSGEQPMILQSDKELVRDNILVYVTQVPTLLRSQLGESLKTIIYADYPEQWPRLLDWVKYNLQNQQIYGALFVLRILSRKYEFKSDEERTPVSRIVEETFPLLLTIFNGLIQIENPSLEIAELMKLICKIFWSSIYLELPKQLFDINVFNAWMVLFLSVSERPVPVEGQPMDPELRKSWGWWKVKKWTVHILNRIYSRFGDPKLQTPENKPFAQMFQKNYAGRILEGHLNCLNTIRVGGYLPDRVTNLLLQYLSNSISKSSMYKLLLPRLDVLLFEIVFPLMCFNDSDQKLWEEDPHEYVRKGYNIIEDLYSPRTASMDFVNELVRKRGKDNLPKFVQFVTIVDKFGEEMAPYAFGLCQNLAAAFWRCLNTSEASDDLDDVGALAAVGCLRAISTILESVSSLPQLFVEIEPTILPIMQKMLTADGQDVFEEVLEIASYMTFYSPNISLGMWSLWPLMVEALVDWAIDFFPNILVPMDNFISRGTAHFLTCKEPDYQQSLFTVLSTLMTDRNIEDSDIESAPKLIEVVFQNCKGQVDQWVEPYLRLTIDRIQRAETSYLKSLLIQVVANMLYYNPGLTLGVLQNTGLASTVFDHWFQMLQQKRKSGLPANFKREHDKKVCCLGLTSLLAVPGGQFPDEALQRVFRATLDLLVAYKNQIAEAAKETEVDYENELNGLESDEDDDDDGSDGEMGMDDTEDGDEAESKKLKKLAAQAKAFGYDDEDDDDSDDDDFSDEEEFQSPIDEVDAFVFFVDAIRVMQASDAQRFQNLNQSLDFNYQAIANGIAQHAEVRRVEMEKEKQKKAAEAAATPVPAI
ncbi:hypothetical protein BRARA_E01202 [Brassica rapa]|uniref:Importin N-terminal domain-containing protein n=1 Tax=Brassica campestris TaxID=3711 RepID=A0A397Z8X3_BRACM|nr:hypothetical protein BRARA_E01202 [Brassica rapa]